MQWFRLYDDVLDDPKAQQLSPAVFKHWINLLCLANKGTPRGTLPDMRSIAFRLRLTEPKAAAVVAELAAVGLLDAGETLRPHNWDRRQRVSDDVAERVRKHRSNVTDPLHETPPKLSGVTDTDTDTDTEQRQKQSTPVSPAGDKPTPKRTKPKMVGLPADFAVTDQMREWARSKKSLTDAQIDGKTERFLTYVQTHGKQYADWEAAWRGSMEWEERGGRGALSAVPTPIRSDDGLTRITGSKNDAVFNQLRREAAERDGLLRKEPDSVIDVRFVQGGK